MIRIEALEKTYHSARRSVRAIDGIDLEIPAGSFFTLVGPSGSGKTTALRVVAGLERHDGGRVLLADQVVSDPSHGTFVPVNERGIGMVFQSYAIWPHMDVFDNVSYPLRQSHKRLDRGEIRRRVEETLELVGLKDLANAPATALSGGQQQRVSLARALVDRPKVLLLDEPLSNLDAQLRERMRSEIRDIQRRVGITALYVTHDRAEALSMSTLVAVMNNGRVEMVGTPREVYEHPATRFAAEFLGQCNSLPGRVEAAHGDGDGGLTVDTALGRIRCRAPQGISAGQSVIVVVRPEDVLLARPGGTAGTAGQATGTLSSISFLGDRLECTVALNGASLRAVAHPGLDVASGEPVGIELLERGWAIAV